MNGKLAMAVTDLFASEIASKLLKQLFKITQESLFCRSSSENIIAHIRQLLPIIDEIKYSGVELPAARQFQLDRFSEILRYGVELSNKVLSSSRFNIYRNFLLARKMERLEKEVSNFVEVILPAHVMADVHHIRSLTSERFDQLQQQLKAMKFGVPGGGWFQEAVRSFEDSQRLDALPVNFGVKALNLGKKKIKEMLLGNPDYSVVGISGMGGSGKTTLARELCRDDEVRSYFNDRILFLTVSQSPDLELLKANIWGYVMGNESWRSSVVPQWNLQYQYKIEVRTLVVLDDVWLLSVLEQLINKLPGCKFLVVSRFKFPTVLNATHEVELLYEEEALSLFCYHAFGQKSVPINTNDNLVKQVVSECKGLPLALKVIGASLREQNELFWISAKSRLSQGQSICESHEKNLLQRMAMSVDYLPEKIRDCFLDLGSFPEDKRIPLDVIVNMWMEIRDIDEPEAFAILVELSSKNLLTLVQEARAGGLYSSCFEISVMQHDVLRDIALNLSNRGKINERQRLIMPRRENGIPKEWIRNMDLPFEAQIVSLHTGEMQEMDWYNMEFPKAEVLILNFSSNDYFLPTFLGNMPKLRALIVINHGVSTATLGNFSVFGSLGNLRSLWLEKVSVPQLSCTTIPLGKLRKLCIVLCKIGSSLNGKLVDLSQIFPSMSELTVDHCDDLTELPPSICSMHTLRNLSFTNCHNLSLLPQDLGKLKSLEILRLYACPLLRKLPPGICELLGLKYLDVSQCVNLACFPDGVGQLVNLEKIDMRECSLFRNLPKSSASMMSLRAVICDDELSCLWKNAKPNIHVQVAEQCFDLGWLHE